MYIPYSATDFCNGVKKYIDQFPFPIPNTNEALLGKSFDIDKISITYVNKIDNIITFRIQFKNTYYPQNLEFFLVKQHFDTLLSNWSKFVHFKSNSLEYTANDKDFNNFCTLLKLYNCL